MGIPIAGALAILDVVQQAITVGMNAKDAWDSGGKLINKMVEEGRDPTQEELSTLRAEMDDLHNQIQDA